jgi:hypothetical protein
VSSAVPVASTTEVVTTSAEAAAEPTPATESATEIPAEKLPQVPVGSTLALQAKDLGETQGQVLMIVDKLTLGVQVDEWASEHAIATLPKIGITQPTKAELVVLRADGQAASSVKVELVAAETERATDLAAVAELRD